MTTLHHLRRRMTAPAAMIRATRLTPWIPPNRRQFRHGHQVFPAEKHRSNTLYLHVGPSGDFWTAEALFAAKHLQPDYVRSIKLDDCLDEEFLMELLESSEGSQWAKFIYDNERLPKELIEKLGNASSKK